LSAAVTNDHAIDSSLPIYPYIEAIRDDDSSGPDGIALGDFEYWDVPALAAGASYGPDTANLLVPSGVTVTTALLSLDYGTGKQRMAVIIG
jgi:hypothetical protein